MKRSFLFTLATLAIITSLQTFAGFGYTTTSEEEALLTLKQQAREAEKDTQKVLLWNIFKGGKKSFETELYKINEKYRPEITLFQEATLKDEANCLDLSDCYFSQAFSVKDEGCGVLTASKYPVVHAQAIHSDSREPLLSTPKTSLITIIQVGSQEIMVINTHGINFVTLTAYQQQLAEVVKAAASFSGPILWAGDFNSWNPGRNTLLSHAINSLNLTEVEIENSEFIKKFLGFKLDHVFSRGFKIHRAEAIENKGSDHNPIFLELSLDLDLTS